MPQLKPDNNKRHSYADYLTWNDDNRWELIEGQAVCMTPAPGRLHQRISKLLGRQIDLYLSDHYCPVNFFVIAITA